MVGIWGGKGSAWVEAHSYQIRNHNTGSWASDLKEVGAREGLEQKSLVIPSRAERALSSCSVDERLSEGGNSELVTLQASPAVGWTGVGVWGGRGLVPSGQFFCTVAHG